MTRERRSSGASATSPSRLAFDATNDLDDEVFEFCFVHKLGPVIGAIGKQMLDPRPATAIEAASLAAARQKNGRPVDLRDTQIAGIALARRATLAT
jgi:hypothetical protein